MIERLNWRDTFIRLGNYPDDSITVNMGISMSRSYTRGMYQTLAPLPICKHFQGRDAFDLRNDYSESTAFTLEPGALLVCP